MMCFYYFPLFIISVVYPIVCLVGSLFFVSFRYLPSSHRHAHNQLSNGFDHYSPASSPYLHSNGGSLGSGSGTAFPFFPTSSSSSTTSSSSCPTRSWSRPASALLPDHTHYCTLGSPMVPSSRVPSWKVCSSPQIWLSTHFHSPRPQFVHTGSFLLHFGDIFRLHNWKEKSRKCNSH